MKFDLFEFLSPHGCYPRKVSVDRERERREKFICQVRNSLRQLFTPIVLLFTNQQN